MSQDFGAEHERLERMLLDEARHGMQPSAQDAARVLTKTQLAVAGGAGALGGGEAAAREGGSAGAHASAMTKAAAWHANVAAKLLVAGALTVGAAGMGYRAGFAAGARSATASRSANASAGATTPHDAPSLRVPRAEHALVQPAAQHDAAMAARVPDAVAHEPADVAQATGARAATHGLRGRSTRDSHGQASSVKEPALEPAASEPAHATEPGATMIAKSLERETRALREVERALRAHQPQRALELLSALDHEVPAGALDEERFAARAMAQCALGIGSAMSHALAFSQRYPASVYFARVRATCVAKTQATEE